MNWWKFETNSIAKQLFGFDVRFKGGGGGSSGKVEYPTYMSTVHNDWLDATGTDTIELSVTEAMDAALGSSPWSGATAYDPTTPLTDAWTAVCALNTLVDALDHETDWSSAISAIVTEYDTTIDDGVDHEADWTAALAVAITGYDDTVDDEDKINDDVNAHAQVLHDDLDNIQLPKFRAGYRDANAVMSSAFVIGEAVILGMHQRDIGKYATERRLKSHEIRSGFLADAANKMMDNKLKSDIIRVDAISKSAELVLKAQMMRVGYERDVAHLSVEAKRIHIVAEKEEVDQGYSFDENDAKWDLGIYQYGSNVLAAISGASAGIASDKPSTAASVLGGAAAGAAAGSAILPGWGTAIGAVVGAGAALLSG